MVEVAKPSMPILIETPDQVYQRMAERAKAMYEARGDTPPATAEGEFYYDLWYPIAEEISDNQQLLQYAFLQGFLPWSDGEYLEAHGVLFGVERREGEDDDAYRSRLMAKAANEEGGGSESDYRRWAMEVDGVGACYINGEPPNTVKVAITGVDGTSATPELVSSVQTHLSQPDKHYMNDQIVVVASGIVSITVTGEIVEIDPATSLEQVAPLIESAIRQYVEGKAEKILYSDIYRLFAVPGVIDYQEVRLNGGMSNVIIPFGSIPVVVEVTVT